jgi:hypothetical protein
MSCAGRHAVVLKQTDPVLNIYLVLQYIVLDFQKNLNYCEVFLRKKISALAGTRPHQQVLLSDWQFTRLNKQRDKPMLMPLFAPRVGFASSNAEIGQRAGRVVPRQACENS